VRAYPTMRVPIIPHCTILLIILSWKVLSTKLITLKVPLQAFGCKCKMTQKRNVVLYLDKELVEKSRNLGFNLSRTFENHLKHLITQFSTVNSLNNFNSTDKNSNWWAGPDLNRRPLARKANVLTKLDDRPQH
jgi:hypothetical protein